MDLIRHEEVRPTQTFNFAPMIDFLFLMLSLFATIALSQSTLHDSEIELVQKANASSPFSAGKKEEIHLSITAEGGYRWMTEFQEYPMESLSAIQEEIARQYQVGRLSCDKNQTEVLLHIDRKTPWEPIAHLIFAIGELGFKAHPVYESSDPTECGVTTRS